LPWLFQLKYCISVPSLYLQMSVLKSTLLSWIAVGKAKNNKNWSCLPIVHYTNRLIHDIFHIGPGIKVSGDTADDARFYKFPMTIRIIVLMKWKRINPKSDLKILSERLQGNNELRVVEDILTF
jgi:hypothetical protein